jgi:hypothetical protein
VSLFFLLNPRSKLGLTAVMNDPNGPYGEAIKRSKTQAEDNHKKKKREIEEVLEEITSDESEKIVDVAEDSNNPVISLKPLRDTVKLSNDLKVLEAKVAKNTEVLQTIMLELEDEEQVMINLLLQ